jgi:hypothetical protein
LRREKERRSIKTPEIGDRMAEKQRETRVTEKVNVHSL